jgi:hypothetical protein
MSFEEPRWLFLKQILCIDKQPKNAATGLLKPLPYLGSMA